MTRSGSNRHVFLPNISRHDELYRLAPITSIISALILSLAPSAFAAPKTSLTPTLSISSLPGAGRLGASLDCSPPSATTSQRSLLSIGAPTGLSDTQQPIGLVYIVDLEAPQERRVVQTISSPSPLIGGEFGKAVAFIPDISGDGIPELVVSQPNGASGSLFFFRSSVTQEGWISYSPCGSFSSVSKFGEVLTPIDSPLDGTPHLLVGSPRASTPHTIGLTISASGATCFATETPGFAAQGTQYSYFGSAVSFIADQPSSGDGLPDMIVGAPRTGGTSGLAGRVRLFRSDAIEAPITPTAVSTATPRATESPSGQPDFLLLGEGTDLAGTSISGSRDTDIFAAGSPGAAQGRGQVSIVSGSAGTLCAFTEDFHESSVGLGQTLASLGSHFGSLTGFNGINLAAAHSDSSTGGSVAIFGMSADATACSQQLAYVNNCEAEPNQEQGAAIKGGERCAMRANGSLKNVLVVGSPGHSGGGRVDIYMDTEAPPSGPFICDIGSNVAATPTPTTSPTQDTAPPAVSSSQQTQTPQPTVSPEPTRAPQTPSSSNDALEVFPGYEDLPPAQVSDSGRGGIVVNLPKVSTTFTGTRYDNALRKLRKAGLSPSDAEKAMRRVLTTYVVTFTPLTEQISMMSKKAAPIKSSRPTVVRLRSRRNRIATRLLPGKSYMVTYNVEFSVNKPKVVRLGTTEASAPTRFTVGDRTTARKMS